MDTPSGKPHLGLILPNFGSLLDRDDLVRCARAAEETGWDSIWTTDHVFCPNEYAHIYGTISEALLTLGYLAALTDRVKLGVSALIVPARNPLVALKQLLSLDWLSGGRVLTAVAVGWMEQEFVTLGTAFEERGKLLDEWLDLAEAVVEQSPGPLEFEGKYFGVTNAFGGPGVPDGGPEIWIGGYSNVTLKRAQRTGVWHPSGPALDHLTTMAQRFKELRSDGRVIPRLGVDLEGSGYRSGSRAPSVVGSVEEVEAGLRSYLDAGCDGFTIDLGCRQPGLFDRVRKFGEELIPRLRA
jgi:alkanesulfonate monooxygenase SsuD/methylene tetrahydromethanopterin reductase-like flavin-dependent oxidoreductase (luciferase family)